MNNWITQLANLEDVTKEISVKSVLFGSLAIIVLTLIALATQKQDKLKKPLFLAISFITVMVSVVLAGSTVYLNVKSESKGPVHWHADIEFWACGAEIGLRDPYKFLSNKIGTSTYHEHNDKRIHLEGVVLKKSEDASLGKFISVVGGELTENSITIPVNSTTDYIETKKTDGDKVLDVPLSDFISPNEDHAMITLDGTVLCPNTGESQLQVYVYQTDPEDSDKYWQIKVSDPAAYTIAEYDQIPSGDCIIFEYGPESPTTNKICKQLGVRDTLRCEQFGVTESSRKICTMERMEPPQQEVTDA